MSWARRLRGIVGTALVWAVAWTVGGVAVTIGALLARTSPSTLRFWITALTSASVIWTIWGGVSGAAFASVLAIAERRRRVADLSMRRVAAWGALGGAAVPAAIALLVAADPYASSDRGGYIMLSVSLIASSVFGAICSGGTLWLARQSEGAGSGADRNAAAAERV